MPSFKLGINMAGAVSAGAYTAGVLDFLTEALDAWYAAKARGEVVPRHDISLEVFTGASAGGMCAAISAVLLQQQFEHIRDPTPLVVQPDGSEVPTPYLNTTNLLYEGWVNRIDIRPLLSTDDLAADRPLVSLLNSRVIQQIAEYTLNAPKPPLVTRPWVSPNLRLYLSLTNLRGTPYSLNAAAPGSLEESTFFYGARIGFQTVRNCTGTALLPGSLHPIDLTRSGAAGGWPLLQTAAMATGAFPVFLEPRVLKRQQAEFTPPHWQSVIPDDPLDTPPIAPNFPDGFGDPFETLNVDGGITNNDPFNYAHDYLATVQPVFAGRDPGSPLEADRAVISIAPFPTNEPFERRFDLAKSAAVLPAFSKLFSLLISQSRFYGESLAEIMCGETFSRFIIAPSDNELVEKYKDAAVLPAALQCASLGAFGGFLCREFRAHDYKLGRRNCQKFLCESFVLPFANPIIAEGLKGFTANQLQEIKKKYQRPAPGTYGLTEQELQQKGEALPAEQSRAGGDWLPIIPLVGHVADPLPPVDRVRMCLQDLDEIVELGRKRYTAIVKKLIALVPDAMFQLFLTAGQPFISRWMAKLLRKTLIDNLGDACEPEL